MADEPGTEWGGNQSAHTDTADRDAEREGSFLLEPFPNRSKRRNINRGKACADPYPQRGKRHQETVGVSGGEDAAGETQAAGHHDFARSHVIGPVASERPKEVAREAHAGEQRRHDGMAHAER